MKLSTRLVLGLLCAGCGGAAWAQAATPVRPAASSASAPAKPSQPKAHVTVIEDDNARIEEARNRGAVSRVTVQSKLPGAKPYEIEVAPPGRDPSQERGNAGRRAWSIFNF